MSVVRLHGSHGYDVAELRAKFPILDQQVNGRRADGQDVCVRVRIQGPVELSLASAGCGGAGGGSVLTADQQRVVDLWVDRGLAKADFMGGHVIAFLNQLFRILA